MDARVLIAVALAASGCRTSYDDGYAVDLTIVADPSISDAVVASLRSLDVDVTGAETHHDTVALPQPPFSRDRQERTIYRPQAAGGGLVFAVTARDLVGDAVATGGTQAVLQPGATVTATVVLYGDLVDAGAVDLAGPCPPGTDGRPCSLGDVCHDPSICQGGFCVAQPKLDGTACGAAPDACHGAPTCLSGICMPNTLADGTVCAPTSDPCKLPGRCKGGACGAITNAADGTICLKAPDACHLDATCKGGACGAITARPDGYNYANGNYLKRCCGGVATVINTATNCGACGIKCGTNFICTQNGSADPTQWWCTCVANTDCWSGCCSASVCAASNCGSPAACVTCPGDGLCTAGTPQFWCHY